MKSLYFDFRDRCVILLLFVVVAVVFLCTKIGNIKALLNCNSLNVIAWMPENCNSLNAWKKGGLYVVFDILFQIWSKRKYLQHVPPAWPLIDQLTDWLPDKINKWLTEWIYVSSSLSMPFWFVTKVFFSSSQ